MADSLSIACKQKAELLSAYKQAMRIYSDAVAELVKGVDTMVHSEFQLLSRKADTARGLASEARDRMTTHASEHHC
jgi:hypothetical protein